MKTHQDVVFALHGHPQFEFLVKALKQSRPVIPTHDPLNDNTELWKQKSAQQAGFDLCLTILKIKTED